MKFNVLFKKVLENLNHFVVVGLCVLAFVSGWLVSGINNEAQAGIFDSNDNYQEEKIYQKVESDIQNKGQDAKAGAEKTAQKLQDKVEKDLDQTQDTLDKAGYQIQKSYQRAANDAEAANNQIQGRAQQDIGRTQSAANKAGNAIQERAEGVIDTVKDLFN